MSSCTSAVCATTASTGSQAIETIRQRRHDYATMMAAAQSADVESAKAAYAKLTAKQAPPANSPLASLGAALQTGDTAAVQKAAVALQQARGGPHPPHHDADDGARRAAAANAASTSKSTVNILA
jgi:hypothetical protein